MYDLWEEEWSHRDNRLNGQDADSHADRLNACILAGGEEEGKKRLWMSSRSLKIRKNARVTMRSSPASVALGCTAVFFNCRVTYRYHTKLY